MFLIVAALRSQFIRRFTASISRVPARRPGHFCFGKSNQNHGSLSTWSSIFLINPQWRIGTRRSNPLKSVDYPRAQTADSHSGLIKKIEAWLEVAGKSKALGVGVRRWLTPTYVYCKNKTANISHVIKNTVNKRFPLFLSFTHSPSDSTILSLNKT